MARPGVYAPRNYPRDLVGSWYTLVLEMTAPSLGEYEAQATQMMKDPEWGKLYQKFTVDPGYREIFTLVEWSPCSWRISEFGDTRRLIAL